MFHVLMWFGLWLARIGDGLSRWVAEIDERRAIERARRLGQQSS